VLARDEANPLRLERSIPSLHPSMQDRCSLGQDRTSFAIEYRPSNPALGFREFEGQKSASSQPFLLGPWLVSIETPPGTKSLAIFRNTRALQTGKPLIRAIHIRSLDLGPEQRYSGSLPTVGCGDCGRWRILGVHVNAATVCPTADADHLARR
jgi:hypothetical protein